MADKKITDLELRSNVDDDVNVPVDDGIQSYRTTAPQWWTYIMGFITSLFQSPSDHMNYSLSASVGSSALTIALKDAAGNTPAAGSAVRISFRSATIGSGLAVWRTVTGALSTVISSGSTAGHQSAKDEYLYVYALDNAGAVELAWSSTGGRDEGKLYDTTAEGGAGAADSRTVLYSTTARTAKAIRFIGRFKSNQTTAGTWAAVPTEIALKPVYPSIEENEVWYTKSVSGQGSTNTSVVKFDVQKRYVGDAMTPAYNSTDGFSVTVNRRGLYEVSATCGANAGDIYGITRNSTGLVGTMNSLGPDYVIDKTSHGTANGYGETLGKALWLEVGDVIRVQTEGSGSWATGPNQENNQFRMVKIG